MTTAKVIWYNLMLLGLAILGLFLLLSSIDNKSNAQHIDLSVDQFGEYFESSNFNDSIKTVKNLVSLYTIFNSSEPIEPVDSFITDNHGISYTYQ